MRRLHPSYVVIFLCIVVIAVDIFLVLTGVVREDSNEVFTLFTGAKEGFSGKVEEAISGDDSGDDFGSGAAGLGVGYILGVKEALPKELNRKIRTVGMSHIIVVSGTHLAILIGWVRKIFERISRGVAVYFGILILIVYVGIVGFTPSLMRAGIVAILTLLAWGRGRKFDAWRIIIITAAITLLINPSYLLNVSWQLSMAAYTGILILMPELTRFFYAPDEKPGLIASTLLSSLAATLACLPLSLYHFGSVSLLSFVANLFILPTIPAAIGLTLLAGVFSGVLFNVFGVLARFVLDYHIFIINILSQHDELLIEVDRGNSLVFLFYIPVVFLPLLAYLFRRKKRRRRVELVREVRPDG